MARKQAKKCPDHPPDPFENLLRSGLARQNEGDFSGAHKIYRQVLAANPNHADALHLDGLVALKAGQLGAAADLIRRAIIIKPKEALFYMNLGNVLRHQGEGVAALSYYEQSCRLAPENPGGFFNRATLLQDMGRMEEALADLETAAGLDSSHGDVGVAKAEVLISLGRGDEAIAVYETVLANAPEHLAARIGLAESLERLSRLEAAMGHVERALALAPDHPRLVCLWAIIRRRQGEPESALERLTTVKTEGLIPPQARMVHAELGRLYDRLEQPEQAFKHFTAQNSTVRQSLAGMPVNKAVYLDRVTALRAMFNTDAPLDWPALSDPEPWGAYPPVFLVGFPRSGTTLLDQVLDSHRDIRVLEERPVLIPVRDALESLPGGYPGSLVTLTAEMRDELRQQYRSGLAKELDVSEEHVAAQPVINKLPLNIIHAGLVHRVFPEARFILALRHPCDTVLSCFMQDFAVNNAMVNFLDLADSVHLYDEVMSLWKSYRVHFPLAVHEVKYEALVSDFDTEVTATLDFLGVEFDSAVRDFAGHARQRTIRTPSYQQVSEDLYGRAVFRWKRYQGKIDPYMETLNPYINHFGYDG
ncbi:MAG: sulfotransferase [Parvularculales bacterium]